MWQVCFFLSIGCVLLTLALLVTGRKRNPLNFLFAGVFVAAMLIFVPVHASAASGVLGDWKTFFLSVFTAMQVFTIGCDYELIAKQMIYCPEFLNGTYQLWASIIFALAPVLTFGFVLSLFKNLSAQLKYLRGFFRDTYVFTELNDRSLVLASDLRNKDRKAMLVFMDAFSDKEETADELLTEAKKLKAVCFKKDVATVNLGRRAAGRLLAFFAIGMDETENLNHALRLVKEYRDRDNTHLYVFSTGVEGELLLTDLDKGKIKVRRINHVQSLINRILYENGQQLFENACPPDDTGVRQIGAVVLGMGQHGTEMVKALAWYGQMDGYRIRITGFDKDPLARERFAALAPELISPKYNGVRIPGEAQYEIQIHPGMDVETQSFVQKVKEHKDTTYIFIALGNDVVNIQTAVQLRMQFERLGVHPVIHAVVYNSQQKNALAGITNYRGQAYDIAFMGDVESSFTEDVILHSRLEAQALKIHLRWGKEADFWAYEYNYRSSVASAIHLRARIGCKIPGADKKEEDLTPQERTTVEMLEHRRWNAYMRAEGYIYSGSKDKASRNDLAKMHHDLVDYPALSEEEKRKDSRIGAGG